VTTQNISLETVGPQATCKLYLILKLCLNSCLIYKYIPAASFFGKSSRFLTRLPSHTTNTQTLSKLLSSKPPDRHLCLYIGKTKMPVWLFGRHSYVIAWVLVVWDCNYMRNLWLYAEDGGSGSHRRPYIRRRLWGISCQKIVFSVTAVSITNLTCTIVSWFAIPFMVICYVTKVTSV
jgi:hypothetical protein